MAKLTFVGNSTVSGDRDVVRFGSLRFWSERGLIHIEDANTNGYECISTCTALQRMKAISDMLGNSTKREMYSEDQFDRANRERHLCMLEGMIQILQKAKEQGSPWDPSACRDHVRRRPKSIVVPGTYGGGM